jgi:hypothetical protein
MLGGMKRTKTIRLLGLAFGCLVILYVLTAPFVLDRTYQSPWSKTFYAPVRFGIQKDWFGRGIVHWYCYDVCRMGLLLPLEARDQ